MTKFNLEEAITQWRSKLRKQQGLEPGYIEEIEEGLRDRINDYLDSGMSEKDAFRLAEQKSLHDPEEIADEFYKVRVRWDKTPPWKKRFDIFHLLPNYLKIAFRNFMRRSLYTSINLLGLVIGIFSVVTVLLYLNYETTFDEFHTKSDQLYRLGQKFRSQGYSVVGFENYWSTDAEQQQIQIDGFRNLAGVENATQFWINNNDWFVQNGDKQITANQILETNTPEAFFEMFDFPFILGNTEQLTQNPNQLVLNESTAEKLFGKDWRIHAMSQDLKIADSLYTVAGVIEDIPKNSHFEFNILLNKERINYWGARTYVQLSDGTDPKNVISMAEEVVGTFNDNIGESPLFGGFILQPITSIHLKSNLLYEIKPPGDQRYLYVFAIIGLVILIITITNYTNLSIAMNSGRNREIGIRKVMGAARKGISVQFLMEAVVMALLVTPLVIVLLEILLPPFNRFMGVSLENIFLEQPLSILILIGLAMIIGILSGLYPAFYLSARRIQELFTRDGIRSGSGNYSIRKVLITVQFALLIGLVSVTYYINQQIEFINTKELGYRTEGILYVELPSEKYRPFKHRVLQSSLIKTVGTGSFLGRNPFNQTTYRLDNTETVFDDATTIEMDFDAAIAYGLRTSVDSLLRNPHEAPEQLYLINETARELLAKRYDVSDDELIGREIIQEPEYTAEDGTVGFPNTIAGFYNDINLFSLRNEVEPYFLTLTKDPEWAPRAIIHFETDKVGEVLELTRNAYEELGIDSPINFKFQEDNLAELYEKEQRVAELTIYLSIVAVILAVLGLVALTAYMTSLKRKEIGIRKVLGASSVQIVNLFIREYIWLILIGIVVAGPLAYFATRQWLDTFAYAIRVEPFVIAVTAIGTWLIALASVSWVTIGAAANNPVDSLKEDQ